MSIIEILAKDAASTAVNKKDSTILAAIVHICPDFTMANIEELKRRGRMEVYPDKTEIFQWDGQPLLKFWPMEMSMENGKITTKQTFQVLSGPA